MNRPPHSAQSLPDPAISLSEGWHCLHMYWKVCQSQLAQLDAAARARGREELEEILNPEAAGAPQRLQLSLTSGHKADLGVMLMDPDPLVIDRVVQRVRASALGAALVPGWSFVSISEVSEYVPTVEQFAERLKQDGMSEADPAWDARINTYAQRLPAMNKQRLYPEIPPLPVVC